MIKHLLEGCLPLYSHAEHALNANGRGDTATLLHTVLPFLRFQGYLAELFVQEVLDLVRLLLLLLDLVVRLGIHQVVHAFLIRLVD